MLEGRNGWGQACSADGLLAGWALTGLCVVRTGVGGMHGRFEVWAFPRRKRESQGARGVALGSGLGCEKNVLVAVTVGSRRPPSGKRLVRSHRGKVKEQATSPSYRVVTNRDRDNLSVLVASMLVAAHVTAFARFRLDAVVVRSVGLAMVLGGSCGGVPCSRSWSRQLEDGFVSSGQRTRVQSPKNIVLGRWHVRRKFFPYRT